jgi:hypothetical protein
MRNAVLALSFAGLLFTADIALAERGRGTRSSVSSERAARAEARSRAETMRICRGCNVSLQANSRRLPATRSVRAAGKVRSGSVWTPIPALPLTSRAEAQVQTLNEIMVLQQQRRLFQQQTQFEINQLRNELQRDNLFLQREYLFR